MEGLEAGNRGFDSKEEVSAASQEGLGPSAALGNGRSGLSSEDTGAL